MEIRKEHFSFSQYNTWKTSPKEYFKKYVVENKYKSTKYQQFGKDLMESLEFDKEEYRKNLYLTYQTEILKRSLL